MNNVQEFVQEYYKNSDLAIDIGGRIELIVSFWKKMIETNFKYR